MDYVFGILQKKKNYKLIDCHLDGAPKENLLV